MWGTTLIQGFPEERGMLIFILGQPAAVDTRFVCLKSPLFENLEVIYLMPMIGQKGPTPQTE